MGKVIQLPVRPQHKYSVARMSAGVGLPTCYYEGTYWCDSRTALLEVHVARGDVSGTAVAVIVWGQYG